MSGYPDDRDDDRDDTRDRRDDGDRNDDARDIRRAKKMVSVPAIGLLVLAAFGVLSVVGNLFQLATLDKQFDDAVQQIENNPQIPAQQKKDQVQMMNQIRDVMKVILLPLTVVVGLSSIVILVGGLKLMNLSSPGLVYFAAILAIIPLNGCCFLGLVFGIWAIVAMGKPEVKAGFAAKRRASYSPDAY